MVPPRLIIPESSKTAIFSRTTLSGSVAGAKPGAEAVIVVFPIAEGVTVTEALDAPMGTVTVDWTEATPASPIARLTTKPLGPAGEDSVTVSVPGELLPRFIGLGAREITGVLDAVIVTVAGLLGVNPLLTINCAT